MGEGREGRRRGVSTYVRWEREEEGGRGEGVRVEGGRGVRVGEGVRREGECRD